MYKRQGLSRTKLSHLMDAETWMDAHSAVELGFADDILKRSSEGAEEEEDLAVAGAPIMFSRAAVTNSLLDKLAAKCRIQKQPEETGRSVDSLMERLNPVSYTHLSPFFRTGQPEKTHHDDAAC